MKKATIRDVANYAKVSVATVSRFIHQNGYVSEINADKIKEAISVLKYTPKNIPVSASAAKKNIIAVVGGNVKEHTFLPRLTYALSIAANQSGYYTMYMAERPDNQNLSSIIAKALAENVCGIIITDFSDFAITDANKEVILKCGVPVVLIERGVCPELNSVQIDTTQGVCMATRHLLDSGRRNLLYLTAPIAGNVEEDRLRGFEQAIRERPDSGLKYRTLICDSMDRNACTQALENIFSQQSLPDGIVTWSDIYAITTLRFLLMHDIRVPDQVAIIGYDDFLATYTTPSISSIRTPLNEMASAAINIIVSSQHADEFYAQNITLTPKLVIRETT